MKSYPHAPDEEMLREAFAETSEEFVRADALTPALFEEMSDLFAGMNAGDGLDCACMATALGESKDIVFDFMRNALASFFFQVRRGGPVNLHEVIRFLSVCLILQDSAGVSAILALPRQRYSDPKAPFPEATQCAFDATCALAGGRRGDAKDRAAAGLAALTNGKPRLSRAIRDDLSTILALLEAVADGDQDAFDAAGRERQPAWARKFSNEQIREYPEALIDLWALAVVRLAIGAGLKPPGESPYLPLALLGG